MAAGGFRTFVAGEVLDEDDINDYLMQGILVFGGTAERGTAIGTAVEGQFAFLTDTDSLTYFDGSSWEEYEPGYPPATVSATTGSPGTGTFTDSNGIAWNYYRFTGSGSITFDTSGFADILIVGGGGGSTTDSTSNEAGGGAGAVRYGLQYVSSGTLSVAIGAGGAGRTTGTRATNGGPSTIGALYAGGGQGGFTQNPVTGLDYDGPFGGGSPGGMAIGSGESRKGGSAGSTRDAGIVLNYAGSDVEYGTATTTPSANTGGGGNINAGSGAAGVVIVKVLA